MVQTALTLALLVGAGLLIQTMMNLSQVQSGYDTGHILTMSVTAVQGDWADFHRSALERVSALPGVQNAAFAWGVPLTGNNWPGEVEIEGQPAAAKASDRIADAAAVGYAGLFRSAGACGSPTAAISVRPMTADAPRWPWSIRRLRSAIFRRRSAIGKKIWSTAGTRPATEIVGVVANGRTDDLTQPAEPEIYLSFWQATPFSKAPGGAHRGATRDPSMAAVQRELRAVDPTVAVENIKTMEDIRGDSLASRTFAMQLLVGFSLVGSVLTLVGIYGVLSLSVASRRREIAIRAAVGAERRDIRNLVFAEGFRLIAGGVVAGMAAALVLSRVLRSFLFGVEPTIPSHSSESA